MAGFGAKYIKFNPIKETPKNALPVYADSAPVQLGALVKADLSITSASGKIFGDDELAESIDEFSYATLGVETVDMMDEVASVVHGCTVEDKLVHYKYGDTPPEGGVAYYKVLMRGGKKFFKGIYHPRAKAALGNDSAQTRTDSITFTTTSTSFTVFACNSGDWRLTETFDIEADAIAWVDKMLAGKPAGTEPAPPEAEPEG